MAVKYCTCGGIHFVDDTPYTIAQQFCEPGQEVEWLIMFMWFNYETCHDW